MMQVKELIKCDNPIYADEIVQALVDNNIAAMQHDETQDTAVGSYGSDVGIAIKVYEKDYDKARKIVGEIVDARQEVQPWCPKCGSEDVEKIDDESRYSPKRMMFGWGVIGFSMIVLVSTYFDMFPEQYTLGLQIASAIVAGIALNFVMPSRRYTNFHCRHCGKVFRHLDPLK